VDSTTKLSVGSFGQRVLLSAMILLGGVIAYPQTSAAKDKPKNDDAVWLANGANVLVFNLTDFKKGTHDHKPTLTLNNATGFGSAQSVVFDTAGNLWVTDGGNTSVGGTAAPALDEFPKQLFSGVKKKYTPSVVLTSPAFVFPRQAVFDVAGNLWVIDSGANALFVFNPTQLTEGGAQPPNVTIISSSFFPFTGPVGIAFDPSGNLYVANNGDDTIFRYNSSSLPGPTTTGLVTLPPNVILSDNGANSIQAPSELALDSFGNLWFTNAGSASTVVEFAKGDLGVTGSPTPTVMLSPTTDKKGNTTLTAPYGIGFDNLDSLLVSSSATPFGIASFAPSQLAVGGAVVPNTFLVGKNAQILEPRVFGVGPKLKFR
jgi:streptogramin lyase